MDNDERPSIHVRTTDAVDIWLFKIGKECARKGIRFNGRKVGKEQIINAILSSVSQTNPSEFIQQINSGLDAFQKHLQEMGVNQSVEPKSEGVIE